MTQPFRTPQDGRVDRARPIRFFFDGRRYLGCAGDTLASALLANGVHLVGRSFKYHRPRGIVSAGSEEPNALVSVSHGAAGRTPNLRATQIEIVEGLIAESQNRWPSLGFDVGAVSDALSRVFVAGFYYKTFMGPRALGGTKLWTHVYEPLIRRAAGLGQAPTEPDPSRYANLYAHCDVLIVGAGPAGLAAALGASSHGARVILCDEQVEPGGALLSDTHCLIDGRPAQRWAADAAATLRGRRNVTLLCRTQAFGCFADNFVALAERIADHITAPDPRLPRERLWQVRAREVVLATGAIERPLVFPDNDRPGIMLADAARTYLYRYGVKAGRRAVVFTACDTAYDAALALAEGGVDIALVADLRRAVEGPAAARAQRAGIKILPASTLVATAGRRRVSGVTIGSVADGGRVVPGGDIDCDLVLMSGGWTPSVHLFSQARGPLAWNQDLQAHVPAAPIDGMRSVGACAGDFGIAAAIRDGLAAGAAAADRAGFSGAPPASPDVREDGFDARGWIGACPHHRDPKTVRAFVDFQNDVTAKDVRLAVQEGFRSIEHVKRYTTAGMATDQGKTSNLNTLAIAAEALKTQAPAVGLTTFRMPYTPVTFGALAGYSRDDLFDPIRRTPIDGWAQARGAAFEDVGQWKRAHFFRSPGEDMHAAVARECRTVRTSVGLLDASTLGKIEVVGPDAAEFLERMYVNAWHGLAVGRCRYGILLNEAGFVIDDGVVGRLAADRFHVTTTTGGAARVLHLFEDYRQTEFPDLKVWLTSTTEQWAVIAVQGPKARDVLAPLVEGLDLADDVFPHMSVRDAVICGVPARVFRVSFTGELGFEVNVPASYGRAAWEAIWAEAERHGGCPYGTETMHVLRAEKGFIIVGQETDGTVTPDDLGLAWTIGKGKRDFVGKRSLVRPDMRRADRKQLVGLLTQDPAVVLEEGAQITAAPSPEPWTTALGHVTSAYRSEALGRSIALALLAGGRERTNQTLYVPMPSGALAVRVVPPVFLDPKGERTHA